MLTTLPPEIFDIVIEQLSKRDLKSLSAVSRHTRLLSARTLWRSLVLRPVEGGMPYIRTTSIPQQCYQLSTEFHFRSSEYLSCPHMGISNEDPSRWENDDTEEIEDDDEYLCLPYFDRIARRARLVLSRFADDQLRSFSWDLGICIPREILGSNGIVTLHQSRNLRSLHLITNSWCGHAWGNNDTEIDLSSFRQLRSLGWKAPSPKNLKALLVALQLNSMHLQELDLDLVDLEAARTWTWVDENDEYENGSYDLGVILGMDRRSLRPYFPALRVLSLTEVRITPSMMAMADFSTLAFLTLRRCPGFAEFLGHIAKQTSTINLQRLEFEYWEGEAGQIREIREFISAFVNLEELFILPYGYHDAIDLWNTLATNLRSLRKFVYHQTDRDEDNDHELMDLQDLSIARFNSKALLGKNSIQHHPFSRLDLECLGLSCAPGKLLKSILRPFQTKNSLKLLHLRQSYKDLPYYKCLGLKKRFLDNGGLMSLDDGLKGGMMDQAEALRGLRSRSRRFLEWAFGLNGLPSLQVVAFGDFSTSDAHSKHNIIACRDTNESTRFQIISPSHPKMYTILLEYGDVLRACPRM
ncbi:hypothetical protein F5Y07DRAFT_360976 [Xylaria sp. FL0933]|nr:hypothetical protein F5Y07DRAFT_360976 [Xylaria sp. FL0933]